MIGVIFYVITSANCLALAEPRPVPQTVNTNFPTGIGSLTPLPPSGFCTGQVNGNVRGADGTQLRNGGVSCSSNPLGLIPAVERMVSTLIIQPQDGATINAQEANTIRLDTANLVSGFFSDANTQYYLSPQTLANGVIEGHQHVVVEKLNGQNVLDPRSFAFFRGINDAAVDQEKRSLEALIPPGTLREDGQYRICSITGAATHQPVLSPIQVRGPQDDCIRINVVGAQGGAPPTTHSAIDTTPQPSNVPSQPKDKQRKDGKGKDKKKKQ